MADGLITQTIKNMIGGVSQQTPSLRRTDQCHEQENCRNDPVEGMGKRHNSELVANLGVLSNPDEYVYEYIERDESENYIFAVTHGGLKVFDRVTGYEYPVQLPTWAEEYLKTRGDVAPQRAYQLLNVIDSTFLLNKTIPVKHKKLTDTGTEPPPEVQRQMTISVARHRYPQRDYVNRRYSGGRVRTTTNWYEFVVNGTTYRYEDAEDNAALVAKQLETWIETEYPSIVSSASNGEDITLVLPAGLNVNVTGNWYHHAVQTDNDGRGGRQEYDTTTNGNVLTIEERFLTIPTPSIEVPGAIWYVKQADYSTSYRLVLDGTTFSITTPEATSEQARAGLETGGLAAEMADLVNADANYVAGVYGSTLYITRADNGDFTLDSSDDLGDRASYAIKKTTRSFSDLPPNGPVGFQVEITGDIEEVDVDPYHVVYTETDSDGGNAVGFWKETVAQGEDIELDGKTMPLIIKRVQGPDGLTDPNTTENPRNIWFICEEAGWAEKTVGDSITAPMPSFTSSLDENGHIVTPRYIRSMAIYRNRLTFVSDENIVFSEAGEFLNFFPTTVVTVLDGDVIDIALPTNGVEKMEWTLEFAEALFLFSSNSQIRLTGGEVFNADSILMDVATEYDMDTNVKPYIDGSFIYFWSKDSVASQLMELGTDGDTDRWVANPVTSHVPTYVRGQVVATALSKTERSVFTVVREADGGLNSTLYTHNYLWSGGQKVQNAWQKWTFRGEVVTAYVEQDVLYLLISYADGTVSLERITLSYDRLKEDLGHPVFLDRREEVDDTFVLPVDDERELHVYQGRYFVGYPYVQRYVYSQFFPRTQDEKAMKGGRLQLKYLYVDFSDTTNFKVTVSRSGRTDKVQEFTGRRIGSLNNILGTIPVEAGQHQVRIQSRSTEATVAIENDSVFDAVFQTAEWEGRYVNRARRA